MLSDLYGGGSYDEAQVPGTARIYPVPEGCQETFEMGKPPNVRVPPLD
jgi:hypothetical protein